MKNSIHRQFISVKSCTILSSMMKSCINLLLPTWDINHSLGWFELATPSTEKEGGMMKLNTKIKVHPEGNWTKQQQKDFLSGSSS